MTNNGNSPIILVTGGCGYIGSRLICDLARDSRFAGGTVRILDNMQREGHSALMDLPSQGNFEFIEGDILDSATVRRALEGVKMVVHLAASVSTPFSFQHPTWTEQVNHWGTARLVEHCLQNGVEHFIYASSASVYGPGGIFSETNVCRPVGPYAQSKLNAEQSVIMAGNRGFATTILRIGTVFGYAPVMRFVSVANRFAYLAGTGRPLTVYGSGKQMRSVISVGDVASAIIFCLTNRLDVSNKLLNVAGENASVERLVEAVRVTMPEIRVRYTDQSVLTHFSFEVDSTRLNRMGWQAQNSLEDGLGDIIQRLDAIGMNGTRSRHLSLDL